MPPGVRVGLNPCLIAPREQQESPLDVGPAGLHLCEWSCPDAGLDAIVPSSGRRCLLITLLRILLVGLVASDHAPGDCADFAVPCHMAGNAPNDGALDASFCLSGSGGKGDAENRGAKDQWLHCRPPEKTFAATIRLPVFSSGDGIRSWIGAASPGSLADADSSVRICKPYRERR
jgi:hypothetical protein